MSMFNVARYISVFVILIFNLTKDEATQLNCSSSLECDGRHCCRVSNEPLIKVCSYNCAGKACLNDNHCLDPYRICCRNNVCTDDVEKCDCQSSGDNKCSDQKYCCQRRVKHRIRMCEDKCEHHPCTRDSDCAKGECCNGKDTCSTDCYYLRGCSSDSDCTHTLKCCEYKPTYKATVKKVCKYTCDKRCLTNDDCTDQCCGSDKLCTDCNNPSYTWTTFVIITSALMFIIICTTLVLIIYCRRRGRCVLFKPRVADETIELRSESDIEAVENVTPIQMHDPSGPNLPPPPYSTQDQPFPASQNQEFPPIYRPQET